MTSFVLPIDFDGKEGKIRSADFHANFSAIQAILAAGQTSRNLSANAGITPQQLANRYAVYRKLMAGIMGSPHSGLWDNTNTIDNTNDRYHLDSASTELAFGEDRFYLGDSDVHELCALTIWVQGFTGTGIDIITRKNGNDINTTTVAADGHYFVGQPNPQSRPFETFRNEDTISFHMLGLGGTHNRFARCVVSGLWRSLLAP
jgi:hypothetical protein